MLEVLDKSERCQELASPAIANFIVSVFLLVGMVVSYLPQHYRIISRRSSEGLSPYYILLGSTSSTCAIANILVLPASRVDLSCCKVNSLFSCIAGALGIAQISMQWSCFFLIMFLFLIFVPRIPPMSGTTEFPLAGLDNQTRVAIGVVAIAIVHLLVTLVVSVVMLFRFGNYLQGWADFLGLLCAGLASIQYFPQIWTTWQLQHVGSLSIPMMCMQTPGAFIFAASLYARVGRAGWSVWTVYILIGSLQGCLLAMGLWFIWRDKKLARVACQHQANGLAPPVETDPLLPAARATTGDSDHHGI